MPRKSRLTFKLDNMVIQNAPDLFRNKAGNGFVAGTQLYLPGMEPFGPFDYLALLACFSLVDPDRPLDGIRTTPTELVETLGFSRTVGRAMRGEDIVPQESDDGEGAPIAKYGGKHYAQVRESLHRLYSTEVRWQGYWKIRDGKRGRPKHQWVEYQGRIITSITLIYPEGVEPPDRRPQAQRKNINVLRDKRHPDDGSQTPPIWANPDGPQPEAILISIDSRLLQSLRSDDGAGENIGATTIPMAIFQHRALLASNPAALQLLVWTLRQNNPHIKVQAQKLIDDVAKLKGKDNARNRRSLQRALTMLQDIGAIEAINHDDETDYIEFDKIADWQYAKGKIAD